MFPVLRRLAHSRVTESHSGYGGLEVPYRIPKDFTFQKTSLYSTWYFGQSRSDLFDADDVSSDPPAPKLPLQADLNQRKGTEKCTFPAASRQCIEHSAAVAALSAGGALPIATRRSESNAFALQDFATRLAK